MKIALILDPSFPPAALLLPSLEDCWCFGILLPKSMLVQAMWICYISIVKTDVFGFVTILMYLVLSKI